MAADDSEKVGLDKKVAERALAPAKPAGVFITATSSRQVSGVHLVCFQTQRAVGIARGESSRSVIRSNLMPIVGAICSPAGLAAYARERYSQRRLEFADLITVEAPPYMRAS